MEKKRFFDKPENVKAFLMIFYAAVLVLVVIDFFVPSHPIFPWEGYPLFYAVFGFVAYSLIVYGSHYILRKVVKRREDYYD